MKISGVEIGHADKVLFPDAGVTKEKLARYYEAIAETMLPHIMGRPLTFKRHPEGIGEKGFFVKNAPEHYPDFVERLTVPMRTEKRDMQMVAADCTEDLVYFADQDVTEIHIASAIAKDLEKPDQIVFDFDPSDGDFEKVRASACELKTMLDELDIPALVKSSGSKGLHVHIPLKANAPFATVKDHARTLAQRLHERIPEVTTLEQRKDKRGDKVFIDILRNEYGQTAIAPYSLRARATAPVATPLDWDEVADTSIGPQSYTVANILRRLAGKDDPWRDFARHAVTAKTLAKAVESGKSRA